MPIFLTQLFSFEAFAQNQIETWIPNPKTFDYLQFWSRNDVALNMPVLDHTDLKRKKR